MKGLTSILLILLICACETSQRISHVQITIPDIIIDMAEGDIRKDGALMLYQGKPFSGYLSQANSAEGYKSVTGYFNGKKEGKAEQFYEGGQIKERRFYVNNMKDGRHQGWWPNGNQKFDINFKAGFTQGVSREWYADGTPYKVFHYDKGHELGSQKMWELNGSIRANYVVKNGHRYGLIGLKNCKSVENEDGTLASIAY